MTAQNELEPTPFIYKLNAMEDASSKEHPSQHDYFGKRMAVLEHVAHLEHLVNKLAAEIERQSAGGRKPMNRDELTEGKPMSRDAGLSREDILLIRDKRVYDHEDVIALCNEALNRRASASAGGTEWVPFLATLRKINVDRCVNGFKHELDDWSVMEWGCAIGGEAGELLNVLKKIRREEQNIGGSRIDGDKIKTVADEIADIIIYCDLLAAKMGIDLQAAITSKFNETSVKVQYSPVLAAGGRDE